MTSAPQKPTRVEREWRRRRREILEAARELFMENGYAGTTMQEIAEHSEYSVGYIYRHFAGKKELAEEILQEHLDIYLRIRREVREDRNLSPLESLRHEIRLMSEHLADHPGLVAIFKGSDDFDTTSKQTLLKKFRQEDIEQFQHAMDTGEIHHGDPTLLAAACDGIIWGLVQLIHESGRPERYVEIPAIVEELLLAPIARQEHAEPKTH